MKLSNFTKLAALACACFLGTSSQAVVISLTPSTPFAFTGTGGNPDVNALVGGGSPLVYDSQQSSEGVSGGETGSFASAYKTVYGSGNTGNSDASATISWEGPGFINASPVYALIKNGNLAWYVYNISGWNGKDAIEFSGYYGGNQGKISHVALYAGNTPNVPDGGSTVALLGIGLAGFGAMRRKLTS